MLEGHGEALNVAGSDRRVAGVGLGQRHDDVIGIFAAVLDSAVDMDLIAGADHRIGDAGMNGQCLPGPDASAGNAVDIAAGAGYGTHPIAEVAVVALVLPGDPKMASSIFFLQ